MYLDPKSKIAGKPALEVRDFLKRMDEYLWSTATVREAFHVPDEEARAFISQLAKLGLVEPDPRIEGRWSTAPKGRTLALASAARPLRRTTAERRLREFLDRVEEVNREKRFLLKVTRVVVFGSYLSAKERINDIDVAVRLEPKEPDRERHHQLWQEHAEEAAMGGRVFQSFVDALAWPEKEVLLHLKSRSRAISLHTFDDPVLEETETKVVYEAPVNR